MERTQVTSCPKCQNLFLFLVINQQEKWGENLNLWYILWVEVNRNGRRASGGMKGRKTDREEARCAWSTEMKGEWFLCIQLSLFLQNLSRVVFLNFFGKEIYFVIFSGGDIDMWKKRIGDICCQTLLNFTPNSYNVLFSLSLWFSFLSRSHSISLLHFLSREMAAEWRENEDRTWQALRTFSNTEKERKWERNTCQVWCSQLYLQLKLTISFFLPLLSLNHHILCHLTWLTYLQSDKWQYIQANSFISMTINLTFSSSSVQQFLRDWFTRERENQKLRTENLGARNQMVM